MSGSNGWKFMACLVLGAALGVAGSILFAGRAPSEIGQIRNFEGVVAATYQKDGGTVVCLAKAHKGFGKCFQTTGQLKKLPKVGRPASMLVVRYDSDTEKRPWRHTTLLWIGDPDGKPLEFSGVFDK